MNNHLREVQKRIAFDILTFLNGKLDSERGYPSETSWGYAFTYLSALKHPFYKDSLLMENSKNSLLTQSPYSKNYPWEFIVFALIESKEITYTSINHPAENLKKKGTRVLNWRLLNFSNKINFKRYSFIDNFYFQYLMNKYQREDGLLQDHLKTRSLQYHNFSLFILLKILEKKRNLNWLDKHIHKAINLSKSMIFADGTCNFIGRGQEQIFGYGAFIGSLKIYSKIYNKDHSNIEKKITNKLRKYQRKDGSFPLILRSWDKENQNINYDSHKPAGWYSYNSVFDYLPFLAYCLLIE